MDRAHWFITHKTATAAGGGYPPGCVQSARAGRTGLALCRSLSRTLDPAEPLVRWQYSWVQHSVPVRPRAPEAPGHTKIMDTGHRLHHVVTYLPLRNTSLPPAP